MRTLATPAHWLAMAASAVLLAACSGDDATAPEPEPVFPAFSGTYNLAATFYGIPSASTYVLGSITFAQPTRSDGRLSATGEVVTVAGGQMARFTAIRNAEVSSSGRLTFEIGVASGGPGGWTFNGRLMEDGAEVTGEHVLSTGSSALTGEFVLWR